MCKCLPGHHGNPYTGCIAGECDENSDCGSQRACKDYKCVDPCALSCGQGADCTVQNHVAICRCPKGTTGDPFRNCRRFTRAEICAPCGQNTDCEVRRVEYFRGKTLITLSRLALTTDQSAGARTHISGTLCLAAVTSARETRSAGPHRNVTGSATGVRTPAPGAPVGRAPTVRPSTTVPSAAARLTSWAIPTPGATPSAPGTATAPPTRPA